MAASLVAYARRLGPDGLTVGTAGNLSLRAPDGTLVITPTGVPYDALRPADVSVVAADGTALAGLAPSSELPLHRAVYRARPDVAAVVHTHSLYATALAVTGRGIPPVHYAVGFVGDRVPLVPYHRYGSEALAEAVAATLAQGYDAALLANHGAVAVGPTLAVAYDRARLVEWLATVYTAALAIGGAVALDAAELAAVREQLRTYGQPPAGRET
jgi:L-fuculose-phosphate aldolase